MVEKWAYLIFERSVFVLQQLDVVLHDREFLLLFKAAFLG